MKRILMEHIFKYPQMEAQDAVKLIYQSVFGCAHLVKDRESCKKWIEAERAEHMTDAPVPAFEHIGGGYVRFYLNSAEARCIPSDFIADMFVESSRHNDGDQEMFEKGLTALSELADRQKTPFTAAELEQYIAGYRAGGYPMVSHTARYNECYRPAYRVILKKYADIWSVIKGISQIIEEKDRCIAAIDGRSASGKSTLAEVLKNTFGAAVVHMDDFFLPAELRKPERFAEPGGNVHYERFNEEVTPNLGKNFAYRVFDCGKMQLGGYTVVPEKKITVVEGAYSLNPNITAEYDLKVFCDIDEKLQRQRILKRNGEAMLKNFVTRWIPLENEYIEKCSVADKCDIIIKSSD